MPFQLARKRCSRSRSRHGASATASPAAHRTTLSVGDSGSPAVVRWASTSNLRTPPPSVPGEVRPSGGSWRRAKRGTRRRVGRHWTPSIRATRHIPETTDWETSVPTRRHHTAFPAGLRVLPSCDRCPFDNGRPTDTWEKACDRFYFLFRHAVVITPAEPEKPQSLGPSLSKAHGFPTAAFPIWRAGGFRITRFEACSTFTGVTACLLADSPKELFLKCFSPSRYLLKLPQVLPAGATNLPGGIHTHWKQHTFLRHTEESGLVAVYIRKAKSKRAITFQRKDRRFN